MIDTKRPWAFSSRLRVEPKPGGASQGRNLKKKGNAMKPTNIK
jgi:hypothetical protein